MKEESREEEVTLAAMLEAREARAFRQRALLEQYDGVLVCFTMNIAGPVKNSPLIREGFEMGKKELLKRLAAAKIPVIHREETHAPAGNELFLVCSADPFSLKRLTARIEEASPLGRLFDMDVIRADGQKIDHADLALPEKKCLICGRPAKECARSRTHSVPELQRKTREILREAAGEDRAETAARLASRALLYEVCTTPKPGLVDRANSGSHRDMDLFTFLDSTTALYPYFAACARTGYRTALKEPEETFRQIRVLGKDAEDDMRAATGGVNTHKGAVFSMGCVCAAVGRLSREDWGYPERVLDACAALTKGLAEEDFAGLKAENTVTTGQKLYLEHGITGARGQMEEGLPAVRKAALPVLKEGIARGMSLNDAGCAALLAALAFSVDTNMIARSDYETWQRIRENLRAFLEKDPYPDQETLKAMDEAFIARNLSPGGSADLLAICYFLYFLEEEEKGQEEPSENGEETLS